MQDYCKEIALILLPSMKIYHLLYLWEVIFQVLSCLHDELVLCELRLGSFFFNLFSLNLSSTWLLWSRLFGPVDWILEGIWLKGISGKQSDHSTGNFWPSLHCWRIEVTSQFPHLHKRNFNGSDKKWFEWLNIYFKPLSSPTYYLYPSENWKFQERDSEGLGMS